MKENFKRVVTEFPALVISYAHRSHFSLLLEKNTDEVEKLLLNTKKFTEQFYINDPDLLSQLLTQILPLHLDDDQLSRVLHEVEEAMSEFSIDTSSSQEKRIFTKLIEISIKQPEKMKNIIECISKFQSALLPHTHLQWTDRLIYILPSLSSEELEMLPEKLILLIEKFPNINFQSPAFLEIPHGTLPSIPLEHLEKYINQIKKLWLFLITILLI